MSGLEVLASVAAIFQLVETGFSLAKALNTYISEVSDSRDDIVGLCSDIDSTFRNLRELALVIEKNETTNVWSDDGLENARKCARDADVVVRKMRKLLQKGGANTTHKVVDPEQIDVQKLKRFMWPIYKGEFDVRRRELQSIKLDILIAYTSYNAKAADTSVARQRAEKELPLLYNAKVSLKKDLKKARRNRSAGSQANIPHPPRYEEAYDRRKFYHPDPYDDVVSMASTDMYEVSAEIIYESIDDLYKEFNAWEKEKAQRKKNQEDERNKLEEAAVDRWKKTQLEEVTKIRVDIQAHRDRMNMELTRQQVMNEQQIQAVLDNVYPFPDTSGHPGVQPPTKTDVESLLSSSTSDRTDVKSVWSRFSGRKRSTASLAQKKGREIPALLRDPTNPGGIAQLKAMYFQRMLGPEGERIQQIDVDIPEQWLLQKILFKDDASQRNGKCNTIWKDFAQLPDDYRYYITNELKKRQSAINARNLEEWVLLYVEAVKPEDFRRKLFSSRRVDVIGVYIVLKRVPRIQQLSAHSLMDDASGLEKIAEEDIAFKKVDKHVHDAEKLPRAAPKIVDPDPEFKPEPQQATSYTPREDTEPDRPTLRHALGSQSYTDQTEIDLDDVLASATTATSSRKAHFADDPVSAEKTISSDGERMYERRPPYVIPYPREVRERSRSRSNSRYSVPPPAIPTQVPPKFYEREPPSRYVPEPPLSPASTYSYTPPIQPNPFSVRQPNRNSIVIDELGTAWDRRPDRYSYDYESEDDLSDYGRRPRLNRYYPGDDLDPGSRNASRYSEPRSARSSGPRSGGNYEYGGYYDKHGYHAPQQVVIENHMSRHYRDNNMPPPPMKPYTPTDVPVHSPYPHQYPPPPGPMPQPLTLIAPSARRSMFESEPPHSRSSYSYGQTVPYQTSSRSRSRTQSSPIRQPIVIRQSSASAARASSNVSGRVHSRSRVSSKTRNPRRKSIDDSDDDTISLASYDGEDIIVKPQTSKTSAHTKDIGLSMLERLTKNAAAVPPKPSEPEIMPNIPVQTESPWIPSPPGSTQETSPKPFEFGANPRDSTDLLEARLKLGRLKKKHAEAVSAGDIVTASDLMYFAIPDIEARVKDLERSITIAENEIPANGPLSSNDYGEDNSRTRIEINHEISDREQKIRSNPKKVTVVSPSEMKSVEEASAAATAAAAGVPPPPAPFNGTTSNPWSFEYKQDTSGLWGVWGKPASTMKKTKKKKKSSKPATEPAQTYSDDDWDFDLSKQKKKSKERPTAEPEPEPEPEPARNGETYSDDEAWGFGNAKSSSGKKKKTKSKKPVNGDETIPARTPSPAPASVKKQAPHSRVEEVEDSGDERADASGRHADSDSLLLSEDGMDEIVLDDGAYMDLYD